MKTLISIAALSILFAAPQLVQAQNTQGGLFVPPAGRPAIEMRFSNPDRVSDVIQVLKEIGYDKVAVEVRVKTVETPSASQSSIQIGDEWVDRINLLREAASSEVGERRGLDVNIQLRSNKPTVDSTAVKSERKPDVHE